MPGDSSAMDRTPGIVGGIEQREIRADRRPGDADAAGHDFGALARNAFAARTSIDSERDSPRRRENPARAPQTPHQPAATRRHPSPHAIA